MFGQQVLDARARSINRRRRRLETEEPSEAAPIVYTEPGGATRPTTAIAVTGSYGIGTQVLYLIDTNTRQLAVYELEAAVKRPPGRWWGLASTWISNAEHNDRSE